MDVLFTLTDEGTVVATRPLSEPEAATAIFGVFSNLADDANPMNVQKELMARLMAASG